MLLFLLLCSYLFMEDRLEYQNHRKPTQKKAQRINILLIAEKKHMDSFRTAAKREWYSCMFAHLARKKAHATSYAFLPSVMLDLISGMVKKLQITSPYHSLEQNKISLLLYYVTPVRNCTTLCCPGRRFNLLRITSISMLKPQSQLLWVTALHWKGFLNFPSVNWLAGLFVPTNRLWKDVLILH